MRPISFPPARALPLDRGPRQEVVREPDNAGFGPGVSWFVSFVIISALALMPLTLWYADLGTYQVTLSVLHVLTCAAGTALAVHRGLRPCLLVASVFPYCWLVVPSVFQISHGEAAWSDPGVTLDVDAVLRTQGIFLVAQLALTVGYASFSRRGTGRARGVGVATTDSPVGTSSAESGSRGRLILVAGFLLLLAALLAPLVVSAAGGLGALFTSRQQFNETLAANGQTDNASPVAALLKILPAALATSAGVIAAWLWRSGERDERHQRAAKTILAGSLLLLLVVASPFAFSRFLVFASFGPVILAVFQPRRRKAAVVCLLVTVFVFLLAYPAAEVFRRGPDVEATGSLLASKDFDGFQQGINSVNYVDGHGLGDGIHIVSALLIFVPRDIWPDKATPAAITVAQDRGYSFWNLSMPLPSEIYLDLGWAGVVVLMALLGMAWARFDQGWLDGSRLAVLACYMALGQVALWRGPLGSSAPYFGFTIVVLLLATRWADRASKAP